MADRDLAKELTAAARGIVRLAERRRKLRAQLIELDTAYIAAQAQLRLLVQTVEPYEPPAPDLARAANDAADGV